MASIDLRDVLDYILNRASEREFEAIAKACERRRRDQGRFASLGGLNPSALAGRMAASVQDGVEASMDGLRTTVRDYVARIVRQKEPGASDADIEALLDACLPDRSGNGPPPPDPSEAMPPEALAIMVRDFTEYSLGFMPPSKQAELWERVPEWQAKYWEVFPPAIKAFTKARLEGRLGEDEFWSAVLSALGL